MELSYLDQYLESLQLFACHLKRNLNLISDLDKRCQTIIETIEKKSEQYLEQVNHFEQKQKNDRFSQISQLYDKVNSYSGDKRELAIHCEQQINHYIKLLDQKLIHLNNYEKICHKNINNKKADNNENISNRHKKGLTLKRDRKTNFNNRKLLKTNKMKAIIRRSKIKKAVETNSYHKLMNSLQTNITSRRSRRTKPIQNNRFNSDNFVFTGIRGRVNKKEVIERECNDEDNAEGGKQLIRKSSQLMEWVEPKGESKPNPNERVYCFCKEVSFGEMIKCDNNNCFIQWFHFGCVNIRSKPSGKWFCSNCFK